MPQPLKSPDRRQRRNETSLVVAPLELEQVVPEPPSGILKVTKETWEKFWTSDLARAVDVTTDLPALHRLYQLYDERERCYRTIRSDGRMVMGSQKQMVLNPLCKHVNTLDTQISNLEDRFGLSPMARKKLEVQFSEANKSIDEMNKALANDDDLAAWLPEESEER